MRTLMITLLLGAASVQAETVNTITASPVSVSQTVNANSEQGNIVHPLANLDAQQVIDQAIAAYGGEKGSQLKTSRGVTEVAIFNLKGEVLLTLKMSMVVDYVNLRSILDLLGPENQSLQKNITTLNGGAIYTDKDGFIPMPDVELENNINSLYMAYGGMISSRYHKHQAENLGVQTWTISDQLKATGVALKLVFKWGENKTAQSFMMFDEQARVVAYRYSLASLGEVTEYIKPEYYQQQDGMLLSLGSDIYLSNGMLFMKAKMLEAEMNPELPDDFFAIE